MTSSVETTASGRRRDVCSARLAAAGSPRAHAVVYAVPNGSSAPARSAACVAAAAETTTNGRCLVIPGNASTVPTTSTGTGVLLIQIALGGARPLVTITGSRPLRDVASRLTHVSGAGPQSFRQWITSTSVCGSTPITSTWSPATLPSVAPP